MHLLVYLNGFVMVIFCIRGFFFYERVLRQGAYYRSKVLPGKLPSRLVWENKIYTANKLKSLFIYDILSVRGVHLHRIFLKRTYNIGIVTSNTSVVGITCYVAIFMRSKIQKLKIKLKFNEVLRFIKAETIRYQVLTNEIYVCARYRALRKRVDLHRT